MDFHKRLGVILRPLSDKIYFKLSDRKKKEKLGKWYFRNCGKKLNLDNPITFNEKIQWLKLYDSTQLKTVLADKYLVRSVVGERIGKEHLIPLLGVWDSFEDIDFEQLPNQFVLKTNHGSGWNSIIKDKAFMNYKEEKEKFSIWMQANFVTEYGYELHYMNISPKIIAEKYMADLDGIITDYRFFCFNGLPKFVWVDIGSGTKEHRRTIFDIDWNQQDYLVNYPSLNPCPDKPNTFSQMKEFAAILSKKFAFVRIDFYSIKDHVYFGEITFTPQSGVGKWNDEKQNILYGNMIELPEKMAIPKKI